MSKHTAPLTSQSENSSDTTESPAKFQPGDLIEAPIEDLNSTGEGVCHPDGYAVFVPGTVPGDHVAAHITAASRRFGRAQPNRLKEAAPNRRGPNCPVHYQVNNDNLFEPQWPCGGCQLQTIPYDQQLIYKQRLVQDNLTRIGKLDVEVNPTVASNPWHYRNKMAFTLVREGDRLAWGLRTCLDPDRFIALPECCIAREELWQAACELRDLLQEEFGADLVWDGESGAVRGATIRFHSGASQQPLDSVAVQTPSIVIIMAMATRDLDIPLKIRQLTANHQPYPWCIHFTYSDPRSINIHYDRAQFLRWQDGQPQSWEDCHLREEDCVWHNAGPWQTLVGPTTFLQVNDYLSPELYQTVLDLPYEDYAAVVDAYCGVGILTRALADRFERVLGIELDPQSIRLARLTARRLEDCRAAWLAEPSETVLSPAGVKQFQINRPKPTAVILDPPRKGCQRQVLQTLLKLRPADVVYISCHPAALARDLALLCRQTYRVVSVTPFDLFPQTHHVETLVHLKLA